MPIYVNKFDHIKKRSFSYQPYIKLSVDISPRWSRGPILTLKLDIWADMHDNLLIFV